MNLSAILRLFYPVALSIFLTVPSAFGQDAAAAKTERRAYVQAAYEGFLGALSFLSDSDPFLAQLSPEERQQFQDLGNAIIQTTLRIGPGVNPSDDRTSNRVKPKLYFSDRHEDFILPPDKIERTAKMDGDIWFNLNIINNPETSFGLMDAFQILFHEFGHTLGDKKNQILIDQVAAKMKIYLSGFYKENKINGDFAAKTLILPYLLADGKTLDLQMEPIVILDYKGQSLSANLNVPALRQPDQSYHSADGKTQSFTRMNLTPQFSAYNGKILIEWSIETKHYYIHSSRFNYLDLYTNNDKVTPLQALEPILAYKKSYQMIEPQEILNRLARPVTDLSPLPLKTYAESPLYYRPVFEQKWHDKLKITDTKNGRVYLEGVVETSEEINEVLMIGQHKNDVLQFPGEISKLTGNYSKISFSVPETSAIDGNLFIRSVAFNSKDRWDLEELIKVMTKPSASSSVPTLRDVSVWTQEGSASSWQGIGQIRSESVNAEDIKMRFQFQNAAAPLEHLEVNWIIQENIMQAGQSRGIRIRTVQEVIPKGKLTQSLQSGILNIEFTSAKMSNYIPAESGKDAFTTQDSGFRGMVSMTFVDQNLNAIGIPSRLVANGWKSAFALTKPRTFSAPLCQKIFSL